MTEPWVTGVIQPVMRTARRKFGPCGTYRDVERVDGTGRTFLSVEVLRQETLRNPPDVSPIGQGSLHTYTSCIRDIFYFFI